HNRPAKRLGVDVMSGRHKPKWVRVRTKGARSPVMDGSVWLDTMMKDAAKSEGIPLVHVKVIPVGYRCSYREQCISLGYAPKPSNVTEAQWRMALAEAFERSKSKEDPDPFWVTCAARAYDQLARDLET